MTEIMEDAKEEIKRIDHLVYVTLKYTRTVDVLASVIERMINAYEFTIDALLKHAKNTKKIKEVPEIPLIKSQKVKEIFKHKIIIENIDTYLVFRKLIRANYDSKNEYRRHVELSAIVDNVIVEINIDNITDKYHSLRKFVEFVDKLIETEND
ncbi:MAG: hypothetical protein V1859_08615 [archaeon]